MTPTTVTGKTAPGASVTIASADTTTGAPAAVTSTTAASDGSFSATVPVSFGSNAITVTATANGGRSTGYAQVTVTNEGGGSTVLDVTDPSGDDNGPGTYQYPTASDFHAGAFDMTRFQVLSDGTFSYLRATLRNLDPTFGQTDGAQLLDVYVHVPGAASTSTQAAFASRNYAIAPAGAWSQRVEVQGFAAPVWVNAAGGSVGTAFALAVQADKTITIALPEAQFGTPGSGWGFSVVLTGQDGFSPDQARSFTPTPGAFSFGVCASGGTAPVCSADPNTVPKAVDVLTPAGVSQATELDPTLGPVVIQPVPSALACAPSAATDQVRYGGWTRAQIGFPLASVSRIRATSVCPGRRACSMRPGSTSTSRSLAPRNTCSVSRRPAGRPRSARGGGHRGRRARTARRSRSRPRPA